MKTDFPKPKFKLKQRVYFNNRAGHWTAIIYGWHFQYHEGKWFIYYSIHPVGSSYILEQNIFSSKKELMNFLDAEISKQEKWK